MELFEMTAIHWNEIFSIAAVALLVLAGGIAVSLPSASRKGWLPAACMTALVIAALLNSTPLARVLLLDAAALCAVALVWIYNPTAGRLYLAAVLIGALLTAAGMLLGGLLAGPVNPPQPLAAGLILVGFAIKLALVPFGFWLPRVAESVPALVTALIVSVLDMAEFGELALLRLDAPWVFEAHSGLWYALALLTLFGGALLALGQRDLKRMLAFSTIDDMGYLLIGVTAGTTAGLGGALLGALAHAACKLLLFGALAVAENCLGRSITLADRGLAARFPVSSAAFIAGALGMVGVPPLIGFAGKWRLYLTGVNTGGAAFGMVMAAATALALFYYVRSIHTVWLGSSTESPTTAEPRGAVLALVVLMMLVILLGLFPGVLITPAG